VFFFSSRRRHTRSKRDWSSDVCSSDLLLCLLPDQLSPQVSGSLKAHYAPTTPLALYRTAALPSVLADLAQTQQAQAPSQVAALEIGRASCRERGSISVVAESWTTNKVK